MGNVFPRTAADVVGPQRRLRLWEDSPEDKRGLRVGGKVNSLPVLRFRLFSGRRRRGFSSPAALAYRGGVSSTSNAHG